MDTHDGAPVDDIDPIPLTGDAIHELPLEPGTFVLVEPESTRQVIAGDEGLA